MSAGSGITRVRTAIPLGLEELQSVLLIASECSWIFAWSLTVGSWIGGSREPVLPLATAIVLLTLSLVSTRIVLGRSSSSVAKASLLAFGGVSLFLCLLVLLPSRPAGWSEVAVWLQSLGGEPGARVVLGAALVWACWHRGMGLGRARPGTAQVADSFCTGTIAMSALLVIVSVAGRVIAVDPGMLIYPALVMVSSGLIGMPIARVVSVSSGPRHRGKPRLAVGGQWLALLVAIVVLVLLLSLLLTELLTFDRIGSIWSSLSGPAELLFRSVVRILALPFALLVNLAVWVSSILPRFGSPRARQPQDDLKWLERMQENGEVPPMSPETEFMLKSLLALVVAAVAIWLALRAVRKLSGRARRDEAEESHDFVWSWPGAAFVARWILEKLAGLLSGAGRQVAHWLPLAGAGDSRSVRGLYRRFLSLGAAMGVARAAGETPLEYSTRLLRAPWSEGGEREVRGITEEYNRHRYARVSKEVSPEIISSLLSRLEMLWKGRRSDGKGPG